MTDTRLCTPWWSRRPTCCSGAHGAGSSQGVTPTTGKQAPDLLSGACRLSQKGTCACPTCAAGTVASASCPLLQLPALLSSPESARLFFRWKLYLADWGYNTPDEQAAAAKLPGVRLLSRPQFLELLRWGVVMEASWHGGSVGYKTPLVVSACMTLMPPCCAQVDDGCEPTPEEVAAGVQA